MQNNIRLTQAGLPYIFRSLHPRPHRGWNPRNRIVYSGGNVPGGMRRFMAVYGDLWRGIQLVKPMPLHD